MNQANIGNTKRHLATRTRERLSGNSSIFYISFCNASNHSTIGNFHILSHGNTEIDNKLKEALCIKIPRSLLNTYLSQQGASFLLDVF